MHLLFAVLAVFVTVSHFRAPLGPGQDYPYHIFVASVNARGLGDAASSLYQPLSWFVPNTLVYHVAVPFIWLFGPLRGLTLALTLMSYVGLPAACWYALRTQDRSPYAALLGFFLVYSKTWSQGGYAPFVSSAGLVVWAITEFSLAFRRDRAPVLKQKSLLLCSVLCVLVFLAHAQVYLWLTAFFALVTIAKMLAIAVNHALGSGRQRSVMAAKLGARALVMIVPSLLLLFQWNINAAAASSLHIHTFRLSGFVGPEEKWAQVLRSVTHLLGEREPVVNVVIGSVLVFACFAIKRSTVGIFEAALGWALLCFLFLPETVNRQSIASRHLDVLCWLLPMSVFTHRWPLVSAPQSEQFFRTLAVFAVVFVSAARTYILCDALQTQHSDSTASILRLQPACERADRLRANGGPVRLGGVVIQQSSAVFHSISLQQIHMALAALCRVETSTFDTNVPPSNLLPLRYREYRRFVPSAMGEEYTWYNNDQLWRDFDWILTVGLNITQPNPALEARTERIASDGHFVLYRLKPLSH